MKQVLKLTPAAVKQVLKIQKPNELLKISTRKKGCVGLQYHLEFTKERNKFDELVSQNGAQVLVDSKALFALIGSEMDYHESETGGINFDRAIHFQEPKHKGRMRLQGIV